MGEGYRWNMESGGRCTGKGRHGEDHCEYDNEPNPEAGSQDDS